MTGSPAPPSSGENTLTVSQSSGSAPGATGAVGPSMNADCGGGGPNMSASRTPSHGRAGCGAANRRAPTGGWANGMPRNTATPFSARPRTCPAAVRTTGSVTSIRTPSGDEPETSGCGPLWPPGRTLRHRVEQHDRLPLEEPSGLPAVRAELRDDLCVEVLAVRHGRLLSGIRDFSTRSLLAGLTRHRRQGPAEEAVQGKRGAGWFASRVRRV